MIALDTNVLVYAHRRDSEWHAAAARAVADLAYGAAPWAIPWPCLYEFFAIATHPRVYSPPSPPAVALAQIDAWLESPTVHLLAEGDEHWPALRGQLVRAQVAGPLVHDARVAALCLQHGATELWSADRDFGRFAPLKVRNPLVRS
ncbi:MAG: TA system VapC family ribonuclease toxin [Betaproteobacteria bacterium]